MSDRCVVLVCGPPCAGKTTYVQQHAGPGDVVLDQDEIAQQLGSNREWLHTRTKSTRANRRMGAGIRAVATSDTGTAWVIRCAANGNRRAHLAWTIKATRVVVLMPPIEVMLSRAANRPDPRTTGRLIQDWYRAYTPAACDTLITNPCAVPTDTTQS